jgi:ubiquinone/menaquinone biosynthesis C-methylase UbiE
VYENYYARHGADRNDLLANPEVLFQTLAIDRANISALASIELDRSTARVLDVGCGKGASLLQFIRLGFLPSNLTGIDTSQDRIQLAQSILPGVRFRVDDASHLSFPSDSFDLVFESTMLGTLESAGLIESIAREMIRVTRPGGYIMLADWRYSRKGSGVKTAISSKLLDRIFGVGSKTDVVARRRGALVPPLGRRLSRIAPALYFLVQAAMPPASGQVTTILKKR